MPVGEFTNQFKSAFGGLSLRKKITLAVVMIGALAGFILMVTWVGSPDYQVLYADLALEDSGAIFEKLREKKVPYKIVGNGRTILVPREQVYELRLELAAAGMPSGGNAVGFELFDDAKLGMTEFLQNVNYQRALQGELARTINRFEEVENSRVHIVLADRRLFAEDEEPARASVILNLRAGRRINPEQVQGIVHLVCASVSGLQTENVTIVDQNGKMLTRRDEAPGLADGTTDQLAYQETVEQGMEKRIRTMLEQALGSGKAVVRVSAAFDFKRQEQTEERYYPDNQVVRSEKRYSENTQGGQAVSGVPGAMSNMGPSPVTGQAENRNAGYAKNDTTVNYEIGKVTSHTVQPVGKITSISVAALVDGTYQQVKGTSGAEEMRYIPRSAEEMAKLAALVKRAVNFDQDRGDQVEVVNIPFETSKLQDDSPVPEEDWITRARKWAPLAKYGFLSVFVLMLFIFVVRPLVRWLTTAPAADVEMLKQLPMTVGQLESQYGGEGGDYRRQAIDMITSEQEPSVALMRQWIKEG
jgi:flagellar M-ring protein FliF